MRKTMLMKELLPELQIILPTKPPLNLQELFSFKPRAIWFEVGFGGGEHLAMQAKAHPEIGFIGCEPFVNGVASLLDHIDNMGLKNIRILPDDARKIIDVMPRQVIDRCFVLFADPWPKARHTERRFIGGLNLPHLARVMRPNAELILATDDPTLADWMKESMDGSPDFKELTRSPERPDYWVETRYEQKALIAGRRPVYSSYCRI